MTAFEARKWLADHGWNTEDRYSDMGWSKGKGYSAWVSRWDWHGIKFGNRVSFHLSILPKQVSEKSIDAVWSDLMTLAQKAWDEFTDCVPTQNVKGEIEKDISMTQIVCNVHNKNPWHKDI